jgi:hypothetical protein
MSVLWVFLWAILAIELLSPETGLSTSRMVLIVFGPLLVGWGIWWVKRP